MVQFDPWLDHFECLYAWSVLSVQCRLNDDAVLLWSSTKASIITGLAVSVGGNRLQHIFFFGLFVHVPVTNKWTK